MKVPSLFDSNVETDQLGRNLTLNKSNIDIQTHIQTDIQTDTESKSEIDTSPFPSDPNHLTNSWLRSCIGTFLSPPWVSFVSSLRILLLPTLSSTYSYHSYRSNHLSKLVTSLLDSQHRHLVDEQQLYEKSKQAMEIIKLKLSQTEIVRRNGDEQKTRTKTKIS